jgi:hypothetical protein
MFLLTLIFIPTYLRWSAIPHNKIVITQSTWFQFLLNIHCIVELVEHSLFNVLVSTQVKFNQPQDDSEALVMSKTRKTNIR